ncbi:hypothetical protein B0H14DRAFT_3454528 [Mycena olivaceomarginata]|nr:hypothetical protein B0H14DRAFT_3454528 [Mycena olivaceomarginata]
MVRGARQLSIERYRGMRLQIGVPAPEILGIFFNSFGLNRFVSATFAHSLLAIHTDSLIPLQNKPTFRLARPETSMIHRVWCAAHGNFQYDGGILLYEYCSCTSGFDSLRPNSRPRFFLLT